MPAGDLPHPLEPGILVPLLRTRDVEWIRSCGPVDIVRDGADFAVVDVDTSSDKITGLPSKWVPLLRDELIEHARSKERQLLAAGVTYRTDRTLTRLATRSTASIDAADAEEILDPDEWLLEPTPDRFIVGADHTRVLEDWLGAARTYICIVSGALDSETLSGLSEHLAAAIRRGLVIDVLWSIGKDGERGGAHAAGVELLKKVEYDSQRAGARGRLTVARHSVNTNARILFGDVSDTFEAVAGSYNWLSGTSTDDVSLLFREVGPVSRVARLIADLAGQDERVSSGVGLGLLRHAVEGLDRSRAEAAERELVERKKGTANGGRYPVPPEPTERRRGLMRTRIVVGRQNHAVLPTLAREARSRLVITGHRWGEFAGGTFKALSDALERGCAWVEARYGEDVERGRDQDELAVQLAKLGGTIRRSPGFHGRVAIADEDTAVVTTYDWLCPDPARMSSAAHDIGFVLRGDNVGSELLSRVGLRRTETPMDAEYITQFQIRGLRSVKQIDWSVGVESGPGWHVLVGDNGSGKTTILRALALALIGSENAGKVHQDWGTWLRQEETTAAVDVSLRRSCTSPYTSSSQSSDRAVRLEWNRLENGSVALTSPKLQDGSLSAGYGPFRRFSGGDPEYERQLASVPGLGRHVSLFDERVALTETLTWLRELRFQSLEDNAQATLLLDRMTKLINESDLLPSGVQLTQVRSDTVVFRDAAGHQYGIEELSDGYRSVLSLTFDIVRQLASALGAGRVFDQESPSVVAAPAIVLIDEVDAHLHPSWQRTVGQWCRRQFPRVQFIVTTHSPLICQAAEVGSVYRLPNPNVDGDVGGMMEGVARARLVYGDVLEGYESGAFGEQVTRSASSQGFLRRLAELNRKELTDGLSEVERVEQEDLRSKLPLGAHSVAERDGS